MTPPVDPTALTALLDDIRQRQRDFEATTVWACQCDARWHADEFRQWADRLEAALASPVTPAIEGQTDTDLLQTCKELRDVAAAAFRAFQDDESDSIGRFVEDLKRIGIREGFGARADAVIARAEGQGYAATPSDEQREAYIQRVRDSTAAIGARIGAADVGMSGHAATPAGPEPEPIQWRCLRCSWTYAKAQEVCDDESATGAGVGFVCGGKVVPCVWKPAPPAALDREALVKACQQWAQAKSAWELVRVNHPHDKDRRRAEWVALQDQIDAAEYAMLALLRPAPVSEEP